MTIKDSCDTVILMTSDYEHLASCSLVLNAVNIAHLTTAENSNFTLLVAADDAMEARLQLDAYCKENKDWPPTRDFSEFQTSSGSSPAVMLVAALIFFYGVTGPWNANTSWFQFGAGDAAAILQDREYYRLITALTLHADVIHLLGNCFFGGFLIHFFCRATGAGLGLFALLVSATFGNYINVVLHGDNHRFVGFSTAVFATIGMLVMLSYHTNRQQRKYHLFLPFMAGAALLAMTGSSGERTDLGAHFFGLISGFGTGGLLITGPVKKLSSSFPLQLFLFLLTAVLVYTSWEIAFTRVF